jgi:tRNA (guanine-N7-)-methyltransferase
MNNDPETQKLVSGTRGREFESHRPDHFSLDSNCSIPVRAIACFKPPWIASLATAGGLNFVMEQKSIAKSVAPPSLIYRIPSIVEQFDLMQLYSKDQPLEVELGSGDGSFLVNFARLQPEHNFLGVERLLGRLRKLDRKGLRAGLKNLRGVRIESAYFLEYLLPPHSATALHVYFPDPWPKRKHRKNRLINVRFTELARRSLAPDGVVYLRTDDEDYFSQIVAVFAANSAFQLVETPEQLSTVHTDFERNFHARGIGTRQAAYKLELKTRR